jgi:hypothetical protein
MSLTSFLRVKDVRERFSAEFPKPRLGEKRQLLAPPMTKHSSLVGTAFDYLLRFHLKHLNPHAHIQDWVAEQGLADLEGEAGLYKAALAKMRRAKEEYAECLKRGQVGDDLIRSAIFLAKMDSIYRVGSFHPIFLTGPEGVKFRKTFWGVDVRDVADLRKLVALLRPGVFQAGRLCILNPTFGRASTLVGGADADFVIDDMLVEVKTTKNCELQRDHFNQLIGYYCLHEIGHIKGAPKNYEIRKFGAYYSRYGYLWMVETKDFIDNKKFARFLKWFSGRLNRGEN